MQFNQNIERVENKSKFQNKLMTLVNDYVNDDAWAAIIYASKN